MRRFCIAVAIALIGVAVPPSFAEGNRADAASPGVQAEDPVAKEALVDRIMTEAEQGSGREWGTAARANLKGALLRHALSELSEAAAGDRALEVVMGGRSLGSNLNDWVFTPIPSCRVLDTRAGSGIQGAGTGPYAAGTPHPFFITDSSVTSCGIPYPEAKAVSANFIAVGASGNGNLRAWPWDSSNPPQPGTAVLTYTAGFNTSNGVVIPICNTATATGNSCVPADEFVQANISATHVVVDVFGYFAVPVATALDCITQSTSIVDIPAGGVGAGTATCPTGYGLTGGGAFSSGAQNNMTMNKIGMSATSVACRITNNTAGLLTVSCQAQCCRVPGR